MIPKKREDYVEYEREPCIWNRLFVFTLGVLALGVLAMVAGCVAFLFTGWQTALMILAMGLVCVLGGGLPLPVLSRRHLFYVAQPTRRARKLAEQHGFGDHHFTRKSANPFLWLPAVLLAPLPPLLLLPVVGFIANSLGESMLQELAGTLLFAILALIFAIPLSLVAALLLTPKRLIRVSLFEGGFVHSLYGRHRAFSWQDVVSAELGRLGGYRLNLRSGRACMVPWYSGVRSDPCVLHLGQALDRLGIEVKQDLRDEINESLQYANRKERFVLEDADNGRLVLHLQGCSARSPESDWVVIPDRSAREALKGSRTVRCGHCRPVVPPSEARTSVEPPAAHGPG